MAGEEGVPVWGIEVGIRTVRAARVCRRAEGGYWLLEEREEPVSPPGPEGLLAFLRRRRLFGHPLVIAMDSPSTRFRTVSLSASEAATENPHSALLEYVHPEPEEIELHSVPLDSGSHLLCADDRARIESYLIALERADLPAYALVSSLPAVYQVVRRTGLFEGDGLVLRVGATWTDLLFLDEEKVRHLALPLGSEALTDPEKRDVFAEDVARLLAYHRTRAPREESERIVLLGTDAALTEALSGILPTRPIPFPGDAGPIRGKGRVTLMRAMEVLRHSPAAIGAAILGASSPPRMELAYRKLPEKLPAPPRPGGAWLAAAVLVWIAVGLAFLGVDRDRARLREALAGAEDLPSAVAPGEVGEFQDLAVAGRRRLAWSAATARLALLLPGEASAPWRTETIDIETDASGAFLGEVSFRLPRAAGERGADRVSAAIRRAEQASADSIKSVPAGDDVILTTGFSGGGSR